MKATLIRGTPKNPVKIGNRGQRPVVVPAQGKMPAIVRGLAPTHGRTVIRGCPYHHGPGFSPIGCSSFPGALRVSERDTGLNEPDCGEGRKNFHSMCLAIDSEETRLPPGVPPSVRPPDRQRSL